MRLSTGLLHEWNRAVHSVRILPGWLEFLVFVCGYAFNPVMIPIWTTIVSCLQQKLSSQSSVPLRSIICNGLLYLFTVACTLLVTEIGKSSFGTTRPEGILSRPFLEQHTIRRYGTLVASLKSKHSFPSGDCAQAMNLVWYLVVVVRILAIDRNHVASNGMESLPLPYRDTACIGFVVGVCFARVFYHCHWIEACLGGLLLSTCLYWSAFPSLLPMIKGIIEKLVELVL